VLNSQELKGVAVIRSIDSLHPKMIGPIRRLQAYLHDAYHTHRTQLCFEIYESFRTPHRQYYLLQKGGGSTEAGPWESDHQYGLAVDFVPFLGTEEAKALGVATGFHWPPAEDAIWIFLKEAALKFGLECPIVWDKPHVRHPLALRVRKVLG
jgi:hypothetical protein